MLYQFPIPSRTYKTHAHAVKALESGVHYVGADDENLTYVIAATPEGRFYPVVLPAESEIQTAINLSMAANIQTIRR